MQGIRGPFLGFSFNNIHSSVIGITRTGDSRYEDKLIPSIKDYVSDRSSTDGQFFYGSVYSKREFTVNFVFEEMTEEQMAIMKECWNDKQIHNLIFDESPYKVYSAKVTGTGMLKHLCFSDNNQRVYRGEGSLIFTCYFPYARSLYEYQEDYFDEHRGEVDQEVMWAGTLLFAPAILDSNFYQTIHTNDEELAWVPADSYIVDVEDNLDNSGEMVVGDLPKDTTVPTNSEQLNESGIPSKAQYGSFENGIYNLYNAGDIETPFQLWFGIAVNNFLIECGENRIVINNINKYYKNSNDAYIVYDSSNNTIGGYDINLQPTGSTYNYAITDGNFFNLPLEDVQLRVSGAAPKKIEFHYLYL